MLMDCTSCSLGFLDAGFCRLCGSVPLSSPGQPDQRVVSSGSPVQPVATGRTVSQVQPTPIVNTAAFGAPTATLFGVTSTTSIGGLPVGEIKGSEKAPPHPPMTPNVEASRSPGSSTRLSSKTVGLVAAAAMSAILLPGLGWWHVKSQTAKAEAARQVEIRRQAELADAKRRVQAAEEARRNAERRAKEARLRQEEAARQADLARRQQADAIRRRQEQDLAGRSPPRTLSNGPTGPTREPMAKGVPVPRQQQPVALSPKEICAGKGNFLSRGFCETQACISSQYYKHPYCQELRSRSQSPQIQMP